VTTSILNDTKKVLGVPVEYGVFDLDILMHINSVFSTLDQIGIGPPGGYMISDADATWDELLGDNHALNSVKTLVFLKVRLVFDPPATSFHIAAIEKQIEELTWRLSTVRETLVAIDPAVLYITPGLVIDGGDAEEGIYDEVG
jgi:hypothetical protein